MFFKIKCYINFIKYDKYKKKGNVNICISDDDELQRFQNNLLKLYRSNVNNTNSGANNNCGLDYNKKIYDLKISSNTKIDLNCGVDYKNIDELKRIIIKDENINNKIKMYSNILSRSLKPINIK